MAKTKISEYDSTAANNTDIDGINIAEGCAPSGINNAIRELMAHLKDMNIGSTITMLNDTEEDTDGGRANKIIFKGEQSGGEESVLAEIQASHDGTADDQKSDLIFRTNDGSDGSSPTEAMRIDSSQNITTSKTVDINTANRTLPVLKFTHTNSGFDNFQIGGGTPGLSNAGFSIRDVDASANRLVINSDGKIGIGVNDPDAVLDISGVGAGGNTLGILRVVQRASGAAAFGLDVGLDPTFGDPVFSRVVNDVVTEAFRIQRSSGFVGINESSPTAPLHVDRNASANAAHFSRSTDGTPRAVIIFSPSSGGDVGSIDITNTTTSYTTSSDYRLKQNVTNLSDGITRVKQLDPKRFNFIAEPDNTMDGFLAHKVQTVVPEAVRGEKDAVKVWAEGEELPENVSVGDNKLDADGNTIPEYQGIDQAKLVPLLTAALQEAIAKIEALETRVAALEG